MVDVSVVVEYLSTLSF